MKRIPMLLSLASVMLILVAWPAHAASLLDGFGAGVGVNSTWLHGPEAEFPVEVEAAGNASLSLSPHFTAVGGLAYGFTRSYLRWQAGPRATVTDADNPYLDVFIGIQYRGGSESSVQPNEWAPEAGFGWTPMPQRYPNLQVGACASVGLDSSRMLSYLALRYSLPVGLWK